MLSWYNDSISTNYNEIVRVNEKVKVAASPTLGDHH